jgi:peptidoglycan/LPS O-acetylase OafA/YrhL
MSLIMSSADDRLWVSLAAITVFIGLSEIEIGHRFWYAGRVFVYLGTISFPLYLLHIKFVAHAITFDKARQFLGLPPNATFFIIVILPLLLAIGITPLMNRIDKFLMAKLFPKKVASGQ